MLLGDLRGVEFLDLSVLGVVIRFRLETRFRLDSGHCSVIIEIWWDRGMKLLTWFAEEWVLAMVLRAEIVILLLSDLRGLARWSKKRWSMLHFFNRLNWVAGVLRENGRLEGFVCSRRRRLHLLLLLLGRFRVEDISFRPILGPCKGFRLLLGRFRSAEDARLEGLVPERYQKEVCLRIPLDWLLVNRS
jgi:hypothetical protein